MNNLNQLGTERKLRSEKGKHPLKIRAGCMRGKIKGSHRGTRRCWRYHPYGVKAAR